MKLLTVNFLTCAVKSCKSSLSSSSTISSTKAVSDELSPFPLHFRDAVLERTEINYSARFIQNILPRVNWEALSITAEELGLAGLMPSINPLDDPSWSREDGPDSTHSLNPAEADGGGMEVEPTTEQAKPREEEGESDKKDKVLRQLHTILLETSVTEGKLVCGKCGFEYPIKEGVGNFLLPANLG